MEYNRLGKAGLKVSQLSFGSWVTFSFQLDVKEATNLMKIAYDEGVNFFDNAEAYAGGESEIIMGKGFKKLGLSRDSYIVSSKVFWGGEKPTQRGLSHKHIIDACHNAMKRLQVDYLDLYFCHQTKHSEIPFDPPTNQLMDVFVIRLCLCFQKQQLICPTRGTLAMAPEGEGDVHGGHVDHANFTHAHATNPRAWHI